MEDAECADLEQLKQKLIKEISVLQYKIQEQKDARDSAFTGEDEISLSKYLPQQKNKLCEFSYSLTGILFDKVNKNWLKDKLYKYTASVTTKAIQFYLELTVDLKDHPDFEIVDITTHFLDIKQCFMLEITPWVQLLAKKKNFSVFMTAISDYSEYNILRNKILSRLQGNNYISYDDCEEENGGIIIDVKSPKNDDIYVKIQWSMKFFEETCHIEHHFKIAATETEFGIAFIEENTVLLKKFCKLNLTKENLIKLWAELCTAIDAFESSVS